MMYRRTLTLCLGLLVSANTGWSQAIDLGLKNYKTSIETPYRLDLKKDLAVSITAAALITTGFIIKANKPDLDPDDLNNPDISKIPKFDLHSIHQYSNIYLATSDILEYTSVALPFLAYADKRVSGHGTQIIAMYLETLAINFAAYNMTTGIIDRRRPLTFNTDSIIDPFTGQKIPEVPFESKNRKGVQESFFSGHTSNAAAATFFGARVFTDLRPQSVLVPFVWGVAAAVPAFVGFSRVQAGKHYPTDVITGYLVGASIGFFNPTLHKIKVEGLALTPTFNGQGLSMVYTF